MDPHQLLTSDHQSLRKQAAELRAAVEKDPKALAALLAGFQATLQAHFRKEDLYCQALDAGKRVPDRGLIHQLRNDHAAVIFTIESLIIRLRKNGVNADWRTRWESLIAVFLPHLDQEEAALFPVGRQLLTPGELDSIARQIQGCE